MPQQEMSFEGSHYEPNAEYAPQAQHYSDGYSQSQAAQKLPRRLSSQKMAMRIQLWIAYLSLLLVMLLNLVLYGQDISTVSQVLTISYISIIILNIIVFVVVNFNVKVTRKLRQ